MINEKENLEMCKIQQKHFLHNLVCIKECEIEKDRYGNLVYKKISPIKTKDNCFSMRLNGVKKLSQNTIQFILYVLHQTTTKNLNIDDRVLYLDPTEYRGYRNLKNQDSLRDRINQDIKTMVQMFLEFDDLRFKFDKKTGLTHSYTKRMEMNICSSASVYKKKIISIVFTPEFIDYYRSLPCMNVPKEIFSIDTRKNKNSMTMLWHFANLKNQNKKKSNNGIVSVTNMLNHCSCIPNYDAIKEKGQIKQRIIEPFLRDLEALKSVKWEFVDPNNNVIDKNDIKSVVQFADLKIRYDFVNIESEK